MNLGDRCWAFSAPREVWERSRNCRAFGNEAVYEMFRTWKQEPRVKTRRQLRQESFHHRRPPEPTAHLEEALCP